MNSALHQPRRAEPCRPNRAIGWRPKQKRGPLVIPDTTLELLKRAEDRGFLMGSKNAQCDLRFADQARALPECGAMMHCWLRGWREGQAEWKKQVAMEESGRAKREATAIRAVQATR